MRNRLTTQEFILRASKKHNYNYDYSSTEYNLMSDKITIICKTHGAFKQSARAHINGQGCRRCSGEKRSLLNRANLDNLIKKFNLIHKNKYDYSNVKYVNNYTNIKISCPKHGEFEQTPNKHVRGNGCRKCYVDNSKNSINDFVFNSNKKYNNKYNYSLVSYINVDTKVKIICPNHGMFEQTPWAHLNSKIGCKKCARLEIANKRCLSNEEFIKKAMSIHNDKYDYSLSEYINSNSKIKIICKKHGLFEQSATKHIHSKQGCPSCKNSKGEEEIEFFLKNNSIKFIKEKTFTDCINKSNLRFDFYLPKYNICIEYDGKQHFKPIKAFGGEIEYKLIVKRDKIKNKYCKDNKIDLIRIKYNKNIKSTLDKALKKIMQ